MNEGQFNPFPGLRPFEPDEDYLFFGREKQVDELLRRLGATRLLSVIGASGTGKSSLVRCGLIPSLYGGFMSKAGSSWRVAILRPGEDPIGALAAALGAPGVLGWEGELETTNPVLLEATLRRGTRGLIDAVRMAHLPPEDNLLVFIDQFEELFRFRRSGAIPNSRDEAALFVKLLLEAARQHEAPVHTVLTMRSDYIGECAEFLGLPEAVSSGQYLTPRLSRDELRSAITGPVAVARGQIAPRLVTRLLNDVGDDPDQLSVLQHALMRTWDEWRRAGAGAMDIEHYEAVGGMRNALSLHAEEAFVEAAAATSPELVSRMFKALTDTTSDARGIRRPTSVEQLSAVCDASEAAIQFAVEAFRAPGRSFLTPPAATPLNSRSVIDISHESLMRCWTRLMAWTDEERASAQMYNRVSQASAWFDEGAGGLWRDPELELGLQWRARNRPTPAWALRYNARFDRAMEFLDRSARERSRILAEQERARKLKLRRAWSVAGLLGALSIACGFLAWLALSERNRAERNLQTATDAVDQMLLSAGSQSGRVAAKIPEVERFRKELLSKGQAFYARFLQQKPANEALQREMAVAHFRLGDVHRIAEDDPAEASLATQEYNTAAGMFGDLARAHAGDAADREQQANAYNWLGETERILGRQRDAEGAYGEALAIQQGLHAAQPGNNSYTQELARTHYNRGIVRRGARDPAGADRDYTEAIALLQPLASLGGAYLQELDRVYYDRANLLDDLGRIPEAEALYRQAIASHQGLLKAAPGNRDYQLELDLFCGALALLYSDTKRFELAEQWWRESHRQVENLASPAPSVVVRLAKSHLVHGSILRAEGKSANAADEYEQSIRMLAAISPGELSGGTMAYHLTYGEALDELARVRLSEGKFAAAVPLLANAAPQYEAAGDHYALASDYANLARAQLETGSVAEAKESLEKLRSALPQVAEPDKNQLLDQEKELAERLSTPNTAAGSKKEKQPK